MKRDNFVFGDTNSLDYGVWFVNPHTEVLPERDLETISIPGRSGDLVLDQYRWKNVQLRYELAIRDNFMENFTGLKMSLTMQSGYHRLQNSFDPNHYRLAMVRNSIDVKTTPLHKAGVFELTFDCKPQRFLLSGDEPIILRSPDTVTNLTGFAAQPLIRVYHAGGDGSITVGSRTVTLQGTEGKLLTIDCEAMLSYTDSGSANHLVGCVEYPELVPGDNAVSWSGCVTAVEIIPRWWEL